MSQFDRLDLKYKPLDIKDENASKSDSKVETAYENDVDIAQKLLDHLNLIQDFRDRLDAIDYLSDNAEKLSGDIRYSSNNPDITKAIANLGGSGNTVDFAMFKRAIEAVITGYKQMALVALTGANNG